MSRSIAVNSLEGLLQFLQGLESHPSLKRSPTKALNDIAHDATDHRRRLEDAIPRIKREWKV